MGAAFRERLRTDVLICDGAMGTMLYAGGVALDRSPGETNLWRADMVRAVHSAYIAAGADVIQTNTFGSNRLRLAPYGAGRQVVEINRAAVRVAREARDAAGRDVFVAGSVSPASSASGGYSVPMDDLRGALREQIETLADAGIDLFVMETFGDLGELCEAVTIAKATGLPIVAQLTFAEDGRTLAGDRPGDAARALEELGVAALGANCTLGPQGILDVIRSLRPHTTLPMSAQPNAGLPTLVDGQFHYPATGQYFARFVPELVSLGVSIIGGCCGSTPSHIAAIAEAARASARPARQAPSAPEHGPDAVIGSLAGRIASGRFFVACQLEPADDDARATSDTQGLRELGADAVALGPFRSQHARLSPISFAVSARSRLGLDAAISAAPWGMSAAGLMAEMLGAHALGVRTVICERGTPPPRGDYPQSALGELDEIGLIRLLASMNRGIDARGQALGRPTAFAIGAYVVPGPARLEREVAHARDQVAAGATFLVTRPAFDVASVDALLARLPKVPLVVSVMPLHGFAHAEYLRYEGPELDISDAVMERLADAGEDASRLGVEMARDLIVALRGRVAGVLLRSASGGAAEIGRLLQALPG
ncbi:MAG: bifunctional homocysteine S-methyltransferase/methylenetetrahydrofolate reductase [Chloroflexi bacterium]|nr:bifunctional homocysteine S-methyltransferase/methylenetetrahydrofolate reductase [Chloroflexota bacterium]